MSFFFQTAIVLIIGGLLLFVFIGGVFTIIVGLLRREKWRKNPTLRTGVKLAAAPLLLLSLVQVYFFLLDTFGKKPTAQEIVGKYYKNGNPLVKAGEGTQYILELKSDGSYYLSHASEFHICEEGHYSFDMNFPANGIRFDCDGGTGIKSKSASLDLGFFSYKILLNSDDENAVSFSKE